MIDVMGIDQVCCGFDFCEFLVDDHERSGIGAVGMADASETACLFRIFDEMGMTAEEKEKIARLNMYRIIRDCIG